MATNDDPKTLEDALAHAAHYGVNLTPEQLSEAHQVTQLRAVQLTEQQSPAQVARTWSGMVESFNRLYPKFLRALLGISDLLITLTQTVMIAFGIPLLLLALLIVEQQRVTHGIALYDAFKDLAESGAWVLVVFNLMLELLISWREHQAEYTEPPRTEFSLRILWLRGMYILGLSHNWRPLPKSPANRYKTVLRMVTITILALAVAGSMQTVIANVKGTWLDGLLSILTTSTLKDMTVWIGGLLYSLSAVFGAQVLSKYVADKVIEIGAIMNDAGQDKGERIAQLAGLAGVAYVMTLVTNARKARRFQTVNASEFPAASVQGSIHIEQTVGSTDAVPKVQQARLLLKTDASLRGMTLDELADLPYDISRSTWNNAVKTWRRK
jgi:hypothetical protein